MAYFGGLLIILALPLFIFNAISEHKNKTWLRIGVLMVVVGALVIALGSITGV